MLSGLIVEQNGEIVGSYLDVRLLAMLASFFVPILVNVVTKKGASDGLKSIVNIIAVGVISVLSLWINPSEQAVTIWTVVNTFIFSLVTSLTAYKGVWKPTGISGTVAETTKNVGVGSPPVLETPDKGAEEEGEVGNG